MIKNDIFKLDEVDKQILKYLVANARMPFTEIAKKMLVSPGTIHVRVNKMEEAGLIKGSSLMLNYKAIGYTFSAYIGIILSESNKSKDVIQDLYKIPNVTVVHVTAGQYKLFCKIRTIDTDEARYIISKIDEIPYIRRTIPMISLEEAFNDKSRLMNSIFSMEN